MALTDLAVQGYRSVRNIHLSLSPINVLVGPNGCGKSNLHRALFLLHHLATGQFARTLANEGGMPSVLWAGFRRKGPVRLSLEATFDDGMRFAALCGLPEPDDLPTLQAFRLDPLFKAETLSFQQGKTAVTLMERGKSAVFIRDTEGKRVSFPMTLTRSESVLTQIADPYRFPHLTSLRDRLQSWRFYHQFRSDDASPVRQPQVGVFTPVLSHEGSDLAAALQTIREIGDRDALEQAIEEGLGAKLDLFLPDGNGLDSRYRVRLITPGLLRPLEAWEMSDGTLRYLCLMAALMSPRPPRLLALNEPEASLHPDLLMPLARRIVDASQYSQIWLATHSTVLSSAIANASGIPPVILEKVDGETRLAA